MFGDFETKSNLLNLDGYSQSITGLDVLVQPTSKKFQCMLSTDLKPSDGPFLGQISEKNFREAAEILFSSACLYGCQVQMRTLPSQKIIADCLFKSSNIFKRFYTLDGFAKVKEFAKFS